MECNTPTYVQGVEAAKDYTGPVPEGFDVIDLPEADYLMFQGEPFAKEDYCEAIANLQQAMNNYDPGVIGYAWMTPIPVSRWNPVEAVATLNCGQLRRSNGERFLISKSYLNDKVSRKGLPSPANFFELHITFAENTLDKSCLTKGYSNTLRTVMFPQTERKAAGMSYIGTPTASTFRTAVVFIQSMWK